MKKFLILLIASLFLSMGTEDKKTKVLTKLKEVYEQNAISMDFEMYYLTPNKTKEEYEKGKIQMTENTYYSKRNSRHNFYSPGYTIRINSSEKLMEIFTRETANKPNQFSREIIQNWTQNKSITLSETSQDYHLKIQESEYVQTLTITKENYYLTQVVYQFKNDETTPWFVVKYTGIKTNLTNNQVFYSPTQFFQKKKDSYEGVNDFRNFTIKMY